MTGPRLWAPAIGPVTRGRWGSSVAAMMVQPMMAQLRLPLHAAPRLADKPFLRGRGNADAWARAFDAGAWPSGAMALTGPSGVGKSHLSAIWASRTGARAIEDEPDIGGADKPRLAEDVDRRLGDPDYDEALFHALNRAAHGLSGPLLLTGREAPSQWRCRLPDLRSRLNALPCAILSEPDDAGLRDLLTAFFRERSIRPGEELLDYLVRRIERSATGAAAVVEALDAACRDGARLGRALARELLDGGADTADLFETDAHDPRLQG